MIGKTWEQGWPPPVLVEGCCLLTSQRLRKQRSSAHLALSPLLPHLLSQDLTVYPCLERRAVLELGSQVWGPVPCSIVSPDWVQDPRDLSSQGEGSSLFSLCGNTLTHIPRGESLVPSQVGYENQPAQVCIAQVCIHRDHCSNLIRLLSFSFSSHGVPRIQIFQSVSIISDWIALP